MFELDSRLESSCFKLADWPLSRVLLKNESAYPWFILVPRRADIKEIYQLEQQERFLLTEEIQQLSLVIKEYYKPEKLNLGALGNVVSQLHVHLVARFRTDELWPQGIWQTGFNNTPYQDSELPKLVGELTELMECAGNKLSFL